MRAELSSEHQPETNTSIEGVLNEGENDSGVAAGGVGHWTRSSSKPASRSIIWCSITSLSDAPVPRFTRRHDRLAASPQLLPRPRLLRPLERFRPRAATCLR